MINKATLEAFKSSSILINTSRGGIVNESDLYNVLKSRTILGASVDVFEEEPYTGNLTELDNIILTHHMGSCSFDCRLAMEFLSAESIVKFYNNEKIGNIVPDSELLNQLKYLVYYG
jgi:D-3-phosphoglycerate dehydrogenase